MVEYETAEEARILHPHTMFQGAYWCPNAGLQYIQRESVRYAVLLRQDGSYGCPTCGERVTVPTCAGEGE